MSSLNDAVKNFLFAASLRVDDAVISKVVSAKRLLFIGLGSEVDYYMYSMAAITEIVCKEMLLAVDRHRLIEASVSSTIMTSKNSNGLIAPTLSSNNNNKAKKFNIKDYIQKLYSYRAVLKKVLTMEKLFTLLKSSTHVVPTALVEHTQQTLANLFDILESKGPYSQNLSNGNIVDKNGKSCRSKEEEQVWASLSRAEYFCAGIFCEAKRRPEYSSLLNLEKLIEVAEIHSDALKSAVKILQPILQDHLHQPEIATNDASISASSKRKNIPPLQSKRIDPNEVLDLDDNDDIESKDTISLEKDSISKSSIRTESVETNVSTHSSTLGKRNLQAFLSHDRRRHLAELAHQQASGSASVNMNARNGMQQVNKDAEEMKRHKEMQELQQYRLLFEIWRETFA